MCPGIGPSRHATRATWPEGSGGASRRAEHPKIYCLTTHLEDNLCSRKLSLSSASPPWPPPHRPLFRPPTHGTSRFSSRSVTRALPRSKVGAPQGEQLYQTANAGALAPAFFFGENLPRGRHVAIFRDCRRRLWQSFKRSNGRSLSLVFKRFLLQSYASARVRLRFEAAAFFSGPRWDW